MRVHDLLIIRARLADRSVMSTAAKKSIQLAHAYASFVRRLESVRVCAFNDAKDAINRLDEKDKAQNDALWEELWSDSRVERDRKEYRSKAADPCLPASDIQAFTQMLSQLSSVCDGCVVMQRFEARQSTEMAESVRNKKRLDELDKRIPEFKAKLLKLMQPATVIGISFGIASVEDSAFVSKACEAWKIEWTCKPFVGSIRIGFHDQLSIGLLIITKDGVPFTRIVSIGNAAFQ